MKYMKRILLICLHLWIAQSFAQSLDRNFTMSIVPKEAMNIDEVNTLTNTDSSNPDRIIPAGDYSNIVFTGSNSITLNPNTHLTPNVHLFIAGADEINSQVFRTITYYDGLGRTIQENAIGQSPTGKDIVQHFDYDQFGRTEKTYLPLPSNQSNGNFITNPVAQINTYYQNQYGDSHPYSQQRFDNSPLNRVLESTGPGDDWALSASSNTDHTNKMEYDVNTDDEILYFSIDSDNQLALHFSYEAGELQKSISKNENWQPNDGKLNTNETFTDKKGLKIADISYREVNGNLQKLSTYYVYDSLGQLRYLIPPKAINQLLPILTKRYSNTSITTIPRDDFTYSPNGSVRGNGTITYQIIDDRLKIVVQGSFNRPNGLTRRNATKITSSDNIATLSLVTGFPNITLGDITTGPSVNAVKIHIKNGKLALTNNFYYSYLTSVNGTFYTPKLYRNTGNDPKVIEILNTLCYQYQYDDYNRQIAQKTPDRGWEYVVYDHLDRPILIQDAKLKEDNEWLFTKYDAFGRVVYTGAYTSSKTREALQQEVDTFINSSTNKSNVETRSSNNTVAGTTINYSNTAFPNSGITRLTSVSYFDDYSFTDSDKPAILTNIQGQPVTRRTKGLPTANWVRTIGANSWSKTYSFYDERGRSIKLHEKNHLGGYTYTENKLDFGGKTQKTVTQHKRVSSDNSLSIEDRFEYDQADRLIGQFQKINNQNEERISSIVYDELGNISSKISGGNTNSSGLQNTSFNYNIRGAMTNINDVDNISNNLFAYKIHYNTRPEEGNQSTPLYNGNISQVIWRSKYDNQKQSYVYNYDHLNQLTSANYLYSNGLVQDSSYKYVVDNINYDVHGNVTSLSRRSANGNGNPADPSNNTMDILSYGYGSNSGNQLMRITDSGDKNRGFIDGNTSGDDYAYDINGNMTKDLNKGITTIEYNYLDRVKKVTLQNGGTIEYVYDSAGNKLQKIFKNGSVNITSDYLGGFQYQQGQLQFVPTAEGYAYKTPSNTYKYVYILTDQLGNNRVSYSDTNNDGNISENEILSNSNYYPMGAIFENEFTDALASDYNYKFQGKELQKDGNIQLYDFGSRMYDPYVGRWFNTDPQNQFHSPYLAMGNSWAVGVDPNGEIVWAVVGVGAAIGALSGAASYAGTALTTGDWDWGSFGLSVLSGAAVGALTSGTVPIHGTEQFIAGQIAGGFAAGMMSWASYDMQVGDFNFSISPSVAVGNSSGIGANIGVGYSSGNFSLNGGLGITSFTDYNGFGKGIETRTSLLGSFDDGKTGISLGTNIWGGNLSGASGNFHQRTGVIGVRSGDFKVRYENDGGFGIKNLRLGDRGDSYRTASLQFALGDFTAGFQLFTGQRTRSDQEDEFKIYRTKKNGRKEWLNPTYGPEKRGAFNRKFKHGFVNEIGTKYRLGALTIGYKNIRAGVNSEHVRHAIQNRVIHGLIKDRGFENTSWDWKSYFQYRSPNKFSSW